MFLDVNSKYSHGGLAGSFWSLRHRMPSICLQSNRKEEEPVLSLEDLARWGCNHTLPVLEPRPQLPVPPLP